MHARFRAAAAPDAGSNGSPWRAPAFANLGVSSSWGRGPGPAGSGPQRLPSTVAGGAATQASGRAASWTSPRCRGPGEKLGAPVPLLPLVPSLFFFSLRLFLLS